MPMSLLGLGREFWLFWADLFRTRRILLSLAASDFRNRYLGSFLGLTWGVIHPLATVAVLTVVFSVAFQTQPQEGVPYALWLLVGLIPWFYFADAWGGATSSISDYSYLVKKVVFRVSMLPLIKLLAALPIHIFLLLFTLAMFVLFGHPPGMHLLQLLYYAAALLFFLTGLSWFTSALFIFLKDISQVITVVLQFGFWLTPILWSPAIIPDNYRLLFQINPLYYIVFGYRDAFLGTAWFWDRPVYAAYFWTVSGILFVAGALIFARLRHHFADVL